MDLSNKYGKTKEKNDNYEDTNNQIIIKHKNERRCRIARTTNTR